MKPSGIGGQAVIEGIMMRNKDVYSVAVRKPDNEIEVIKKECKLTTEKYKFLKFPVIRGIFNFIDSLVLGTSTLTYSASFYDDPAEQESTAVDHLAKAVFKERLDSIIMAVTILISIAVAMGLFMVLPYYSSRLLTKYIVSGFVLNLIEGIIRLVIFLIYVVLISFMKDIRRVYMYHGAEHKCINCIESGKVLNVENVRKSSRLHKRCGTSFMFLVLIVSVIFLIFVNFESKLAEVFLRILLIPLIAGVSYEIIMWAGRNDNIFTRMISAPGMAIQKLTTREPDDAMIEVAIKAVEEVFDWKEFLAGYDYSGEDISESDDGSDAAAQANAQTEISDEASDAQDMESVSDLEMLDGAEDTDTDLNDVADENGEVVVADESGVNEAESDETDDDSDDGISFLDDSDDVIEVPDVPIFKNRKTDL